MPNNHLNLISNVASSFIKGGWLVLEVEGQKKPIYIAKIEGKNDPKLELSIKATQTFGPTMIALDVPQISDDVRREFIQNYFRGTFNSKDAKISEIQAAYGL